MKRWFKVIAKYAFPLLSINWQDEVLATDELCLDGVRDWLQRHPMDVEREALAALLLGLGFQTSTLDFKRSEIVARIDPSCLRYEIPGSFPQDRVHLSGVLRFNNETEHRFKAVFHGNRDAQGRKLPERIEITNLHNFEDHRTHYFYKPAEISLIQRFAEGKCVYDATERVVLG